MSAFTVMFPVFVPILIMGDFIGDSGCDYEDTRDSLASIASLQSLTLGLSGMRQKIECARNYDRKWTKWKINELRQENNLKAAEVQFVI